MAQLVLGAVGAVVGGFFGGPGGASAGWAIGSAIGGFFAPGPPDINQAGPRLSDLRAQISSYGAPLGRIWGRYQVAGTVIWARDIIERETTTSEEVGGKGGGGGQTVTTTTYSYYGFFAVAIARHEITAVLRMWLNGTLVYDARPGVDAHTKLASDSIKTYFEVFLGTETQGPSSVMEAWEGDGNVEAYRGTSYIVFDDLPLADYGNSFPQVHVEVLAASQTEVSTKDIQALVIHPWEIITDSTGAEQLRHSQGGRTLYQAIALEDGTIVAEGEDYRTVLTAAQALFPGYTNYVGFYTGTTYDLSCFIGHAALFAGGGPVLATMCYSPGPAELLDNGPPSSSGGAPAICGLGIDPDEPKLYVVRNIQWDWADADHTMTGVATVIPAFSSYGSVSQGRGYCVGYAPKYPEPYFPLAVTGRFLEIRAYRLPSPPAATCLPGDPASSGIAELPSDGNFCLSSDGQLSTNVRFDIEVGSWLQLQKAQPNLSAPTGSVSIFGKPPVMLASDPNNTQAFWESAAASAGLAGTYPANFPEVVTEVGSSVNTIITYGSAFLSTIVRDICLEAGLSASQLDTTDLTDEVLGFCIGRVASARASLDVLRRAFLFDCVEIGGKLVFRKRGHPSVATIPATALGAGIDTGAPQLVEHTRAQEADLPTALSLTYSSLTIDYETAVQSARRLNIAKGKEDGAEIPVVLTDQKAADLAWILLYDVWMARASRRFSVPLEYARLVPTDVVDLSDGEFDYTVMLLSRDDAGGVLTFEARDVRPSLYTDPTTSVGAVSGGGQTLTAKLPLNLVPLDIPIYRDADNDTSGFYAAVGAFGNSGFSGGKLYRSLDGGATYTVLDSVSVEAAIGLSDGDHLGAFFGGNVVDEVHTLRVRMISGTLSSCTRAQLLNGSNAAVLGAEVLQFQRATLVAPGVFDLTGLLRGRLGTEAAMLHTAQENFAVLSTSTIKRFASERAVVNVASLLKVVGLGSRLSQAYQKEFTNTARGGLPYAPVHLRAVKDPAALGTWNLQWVRRTRVSGLWLDYVDVPLGETTELYRVTVSRAGAEVFAVTVSAPSYVLTSAATGAALGDVVTVAQISESLGPGIGASVSLLA